MVFLSPSVRTVVSRFDRPSTTPLQHNTLHDRRIVVFAIGGMSRLTFFQASCSPVNGRFVSIFMQQPSHPTWKWFMAKRKCLIFSGCTRKKVKPILTVFGPAFFYDASLRAPVQGHIHAALAEKQLSIDHKKGICIVDYRDGEWACVIPKCEHTN